MNEIRRTNGFKTIYDGTMSNLEIIDWIITLTRESGNENRISRAASILRDRFASEKAT